MNSEPTGDIADRHRLGVAALERFRRDSAPADLRAAVELLRDASDAATEAAIAAVGVDLAEALRRAAGDHDARSVCRDAAMSYLGVDVPGWDDEAVLSGIVAVLRADLTSTPAGHPELAGRLVHLGNAQLRRSELPGHEDDLDEAVTHFTAAVADGPRRGAGRHRWRSKAAPVPISGTPWRRSAAWPRPRDVAEPPRFAACRCRGGTRPGRRAVRTAA